MAKSLVGTVTATKMTGSIVVEVTNRVPHPLYKKLLKRSKKYTVDMAGKEAKVGDSVRIVETRKMAKNKNFKLEEVLK